VTRYKLTLEYDGTPFAGWQRQASGPSVQAALEDAVFAFCAERVTVFGAGRTDSGVHALGQVAHFDISKDTDTGTVRDALNYYLGDVPVAVLVVEVVGGDFDARRSASARAYRYRILNRRPPPVLEKSRVWWVPGHLDAAAMHVAAQVLVGHHDFTTFRAALCQAKSPCRTLDRLDVVRHGAEVHIHAEARSFLHHQVRNMAGTLRLVGNGKWTADNVRRVLRARDRSAAGATAPAAGLTLMEVRYD